MSFFKIKVDKNDMLFSKLVRSGKTRCQKCGKPNQLQCCHIFDRGNRSTRWTERNAIALCLTCHEWFDSTKAKDILFKKELQDIEQPDNRWWWLVNKSGLNYSWRELQILYHASLAPFLGYKYKKEMITRALQRKLAMKSSLIQKEHNEIKGGVE